MWEKNAITTISSAENDGIIAISIKNNNNNDNNTEIPSQTIASMWKT